MAIAELDRDVCYRALRTRDARFDGRFFTAVVTTGIYCRPVCPARTPKIDNCLFLPSAGAAHEMGFRPCLRCRPEVAPGRRPTAHEDPGWRGAATTVTRALGLIAEGGFEDGADELAARLGVGGRHLRRLFDRYVGASPVSVAQAHRILFAKKLISETNLGMTEIALAAGFGSVRRFNDVFRTTYGRPPSDLRRKKRLETRVTGGGVELKLPYAPPYDWPTMIAFLAGHVMPGVELVVGDTYRRTFSIDDATGWLAVRPAPGENHLLATIHTTRIEKLALVVARLRRMFDLDADIVAIDAQLARDPVFTARVKARPGLRMPGAWDPFELAVRAVLGQQVSVKAATTFANRLVETLGAPLDSSIMPNRLFPTAAALAAGDLTKIGVTTTRAATLASLAAALVANPHLLRPRESLDVTVEALCQLPGIGPWTAQVICMRALREPDAWPTADLGLLRVLATDAGRPTPAALAKRAEAWRPWRAYAALRLWTQPDSP